MNLLQKPARNNTKQQKQKKKKNSLPTVVNQITWCFTMTEQREKKDMKNQVRSRERSK